MDRIFDQSNGTYNPNKDIRFKTPQIRDDLCDFNDAYIVVTGKINAVNSNLPNYADISNNARADYTKKVALKNFALFFNCILKINNQLIEDAQDLDIVMPMFNLLCSSNSAQPDGQADNLYERTKVFYPIKNSESFD